MILKPIAKNQTELSFTWKSGQMTLFFSYSTPVAYVFDGMYAKKTGNVYSTTTTNHIKAFFYRYGFDPDKVEIVNQEYFDFINYTV
jgi:hypothetical protein